MRLSHYFFKTIKEVPNDADLKSHRLMVRGGYIKQVGAGIFSYFPIAVRCLKKIEAIIREEMDGIGGQEINLPVVMPANIWVETGRYQDTGDELLRFTDRVKRKMVLGMTHEEAVTDLARYCLNSYKQLPVMLYQIQTKFRDEMRVRGGLIRVREFVMKDAYSFHPDQQNLDQYYDRAHQAYLNIFKRCGLPVISVKSDVGMMGGSGAHEFMAITESGEDTLFLCDQCDYKANKEVARAHRKYEKAEMLNQEEIHTPGKKTIQELSEFLKIEQKQTMKAVVYWADEELVLCLIRGDLDINETKLKNYLKAHTMLIAEDSLLQQAGIVPGFASPVNTDNVRIIVDESVKESGNLVSGANKTDYHIKNVNFGRDFSSEEIIDMSSVNEGETCPQCNNGSLKICRGIEVGNIFKLGVKYSKSMNANFLDDNGKEKNLIMGCYGIGVGRAMAAVLELTAEENKICWPITIAPFEIELIGIYKESDRQVILACNNAYNKLKDAGFSIVYDDRKASAGFKFNDAALIGSPVQITIGAKSLEKGGAEVNIMDDEKIMIPVNNLVKEIKKIKNKLMQKYQI